MGEAARPQDDAEDAEDEGDAEDQLRPFVAARQEGEGGANDRRARRGPAEGPAPSGDGCAEKPPKKPCLKDRRQSERPGQRAGRPRRPDRKSAVWGKSGAVGG